MKIRVLGAHNSETLKTRLACILIDGAMAIDAGAITSTLTLAEQKRIKAILITHRHYDHIRDLLTLGINTADLSVTDVYGLKEALESVSKFHINGELYPDFTKRPDGRPKYNLKTLEPGEVSNVMGYEITGLEVSHNVPAMGFLVSKNGRSIFFSGDCSGGLSDALTGRKVDILFTEVTYSDSKMTEAMRHSHLSPAMLAGQLLEMDPRPPRVIALHMLPAQEPQIKRELAAFSKTAGLAIEVGVEGQVIEI